MDPTLRTFLKHLLIAWWLFALGMIACEIVIFAGYYDHDFTRPLVLAGLAVLIVLKTPYSLIKQARRS